MHLRTGPARFPSPSARRADSDMEWSTDPTEHISSHYKESTTQLNTIHVTGCTSSFFYLHKMNQFRELVRQLEFNVPFAAQIWLYQRRKVRDGKLSVPSEGWLVGV